MSLSLKRALALLDEGEELWDDTPPPKRRATDLPHNSQELPASLNDSLNISSVSSSLQATPTESEYINLTQEEAPDREFYGDMDGKIVGVRYYKGHASPGEVVLCRREPKNQYDSNAIRVDNVLHQQIGHLPRTIVSKLATFMDSGDLTVEATLTGEKGMFECPVRLLIYGPSDTAERTRVEAALKPLRIIKAAQLKKTRKDAETRRKGLGLSHGSSTAQGLGTESSSAGSQVMPEISLEEILKTSEAVELRKDWDAVKTLALSEEQLANMPLAEQPGHMETRLLPYQLQGLSWMLSKELPQLHGLDENTVVQLWKRDKQGRYWNAASDHVCTQMPTLFSGGILADDMGLGKTLQVISLIVIGGPGTTLIITPVSVMSNWEQQVRKHVREDRQPKILIYHGSKKPPAKDLFNYDIVITSYGTLTQNFDGSRDLLDQPSEWRRVVLDEGHIIRNVRTKVAIAATQLKAKSRWIVTGTPIVNSVKDLFSMVKFLGITGGVEQSEVFNSAITRRLAAKEREGEVILQLLMQDICLRRKKDMKFVNLNLPKKTEYVHRIAFRPDEKVRYNALLSEARGMLAKYQQESNAGQKGRFQNVLERLLRLRQICNHWTICRERIDDLMKLLEEYSVVPLTEKHRALLQEALRLFIDNQDDCAICFDPPTNAVITNCKHVFCHPCISKAIQIQHKCPMCRNPLTEDKLIEPAPEGGFDSQTLDPDRQSSKTEALLQILKATLKKGGSKVVIFSQWTSFLNIIQNQLEVANMKFCRIDGSMSTDKRDVAIGALDNDPETRIMLASLAVCSVGLNLVSADTVILADSWWAPAIEDQAVDRVHRLGQTRETSIWRLVMDGTVEERVLDIQQEKRKLVTKAFQEKGGGKKSRDTRIADVMKLLG